jgi:hypothetical protein
LLEAVKNLLSVLAPDRFLHIMPFLGRALTLGSLLVLPVLVIILLRLGLRLPAGQDHRRQAGREAMAFALGLHILVYLAALVFSISFLDASTPLNTRILSVVSLAELILLMAGLAWAWQKAGVAAKLPSTPGGGWINTVRPTVRPAVALACAGLAVFGAWDGVFAVQRYSQEGQGEFDPETVQHDRALFLER